MEPLGQTIAEHWELFGAMWGGAVFLISGVASWTAARAGAKYAITSHTEKLSDHNKRLQKLEETVGMKMTESKCKEYRLLCQGELEDDECGITKKLDKLTVMFEDLEKRRSERWTDFERRREASKDSLQKTFEMFTKKITRLETIINERSRIFRQINGKVMSEMSEIPCIFDEEEGGLNSGFSNAVYP